MDKFEQLRTNRTNGDNYDVSNDDIIARLRSWDEKYGVELSDIEHDKVTVRFNRLPDDVGSLAREIDSFCPDVIAQNFGCFDELIDTAEEMGMPISDDIRKLVDGVDFEDEKYGMELLTRSLTRSMGVGLWWD